MTPRDQALLAARLAAYGSADVRTPSDYTWQEALDEYGREMAAKKLDKKNAEPKVKSY